MTGRMKVRTRSPVSPLTQPNYLSLIVPPSLTAAVVSPPPPPMPVSVEAAPPPDEPPHAAMIALMFYSPLVADQIKSRRKTVTIRLGDKSGKYEKGMIVAVLVGQRFGPRERVFDAVIDKVEVKPLGDVSPREIQHENPALRTLDEFVDFLRKLYNRDVREDDTVTVIHFSEIR